MSALPAPLLGLGPVIDTDTRLIVLGNVYGYGSEAPSPLTAATPLAPTSVKGRVRAAMWERALAANVPALEIRASDYLGSGAGSLFTLMTLPSLLAGKPGTVSGDLDALPPEVRLFDPRAALDGGCDGLDCYRAVAAAAASLLAPRGFLVVELGAGQVEPVAGLIAAAGLAPLTVRPDLKGVTRALVAENAV